MDKAQRDKIIIAERQKEKPTPFHVLGERFGITPSRAHQIYQRKREFYERLPEQKHKTSRVRRISLTKHDVAKKLGIPESRLELRV